MIKKLTLPASIRTRSRLVLFAVTMTIGLSGCSQSSQWLTKNPFASHAAMAEISATNQHVESPEFDISEDVDSTQQSNFQLTNFKEPSKSDHTKQPIDSSVEILSPPSPNASQAIPVSTHQHQRTQVVAPHKFLTTLAEGESLDAKLKNASGIVIVDFYADWCGPCRRQSSILHSMEAKAAETQATIIKVNIEQHRQLAAKYKVSSLPTLIAVKDGNVVRRQIGLANRNTVFSLMQL